MSPRSGWVVVCALAAACASSIDKRPSAATEKEDAVTARPNGEEFSKPIAQAPRDVRNKTAAAPAVTPSVVAPLAEPAPASVALSHEAKADDAAALRRSRPAKASGYGLGQGVGASSSVTVGALGTLGRGAGGGGSYAQQPAAVREEREAYAFVREQGFSSAHDEPLSTFAADVDTASYSNVRRFLREGRLPPRDAVRIEELINYFDYDYGAPQRGEPFAIHAEVSECPWNRAHRLVHVGIKARDLAEENVPARNLTFLIDVSGSMESPDKLPLLTQGLSLLASRLREQDRIALVVYAGASGVVLDSTSGRDRKRVIDALGSLSAGGSTHGSAGIELAYQIAAKNFVPGGINRVILATDGDFNVGVTSEGELVRLIEEKRKSGVYLTVLGFGTGNLQDARMEQLADKGNGNYAYIDTLEEAQKVLVREAGSTLVTVAKDVKLQIEWNPAHVESYRLIGYENRALAAKDFNDDKKDAGEVGAGHDVTALYEIVPASQRAHEETAAAHEPEGRTDPLRYQAPRELTEPAHSSELCTVKIRYKAPDRDTSQALAYAVHDAQHALATSSEAFRFSAAVAGFGLVLRASEHRGQAELMTLMELAESALGADPHGERHELLDMMRAAKRLGAGT